MVSPLPECATEVPFAPDLAVAGPVLVAGQGACFSTVTVLSTITGRKGSASNIQDPNTMQPTVPKNKRLARYPVLLLEVMGAFVFFELSRSMI